MTFGKVMGGGFPAAAFGGRADVMALLAPDGPVYQAGTLSGNPVATAAGLATLRACDDALYARLGEVSRTIADAASAALSGAGVPHRIQWAGSMFSRLLPRRARCAPTTTRATRTPPRSAGSSTRCSTPGVYLPPSAFESWFVSGGARRRRRRAGRSRPCRGPPGPPPGRATGTRA